MYRCWQNKAKQHKKAPKQANAAVHHSNINKRAKNNKSKEWNEIAGKGEREKEYEKTRGKKNDYERRKGMRATTHNELKEENWEKQHGKGNKNNR